MEVPELPGPARERDHAGEGRSIEHDLPERVAVPRPVDNEVTVQHAGSRIADRLGVDDPRVDLDRADVRRGDPAGLAGAAHVAVAVLRHMENSAPPSMEGGARGSDDPGGRNGRNEHEG